MKMCQYRRSDCNQRIVSSLTHVIFRGLPNKTPEEEKRHKEMHEAMIEAAKKKGAYEMKQKVYVLV